MPRSTRWSSASASSRPDADAGDGDGDGAPVARVAWRPSRWVSVALLLLSILAPFAVLASDIPRIAAWPLAAFPAAAGLRRAWRESRQPARMLELLPGPAGAGAGAPAGGIAGRATLDGIPLVAAAVAWRGPLAFLRWRDAAGRRGRLSWWPDTLPPAERRVLKLWSPGGPGMAP